MQKRNHRLTLLAVALELIPNNSATESHPVYFSVEFYEEDERE